MSPRVAWVVPEDQGGIRAYSDALLPWIERACGTVETLVGEVHSRRALTEMVTRLRDSSPEIIHIQHEFGLFGSKIPPFYSFPKWVAAIRRTVPHARLIATAHTVLGPDYELPWKDRELQAPARWLFNKLALQAARSSWIQGTWGRLDGVIVHSEYQRDVILASALRGRAAPQVTVIPHFVPGSRGGSGAGVTNPSIGDVSRLEPVILVFGYFSPEKGQDVVLEAFAKMRTRAHLVLAGGVRRAGDQPYLDRCRDLTRALGIESRVTVTGFLSEERIDFYYAQAALVVAPFRETSGSGSLAQAFAKGAAVLASDLKINLEIAEREPGALSLFHSLDATDCAEKMDFLLSHPEVMKELRAGAQRYAAACTPARIAGMHADFYEKLK
jgi:glycosyltransferase involved in cell wall biosynthesis